MYESVLSSYPVKAFFLYFNGHFRNMVCLPSISLRSLFPERKRNLIHSSRY
jgi:hypothetical protein